MAGHPVAGLRTAIYEVPDRETAKARYARALGVAPYFDEAFYVSFQVGGYELGFVPGPTAAEEKKANVIACWGVPDVRPLYDAWLAAGATALEARHDKGDGIVVAAVHDPWGNAIGLIVNPHFKRPGA